MLSPAVFISFNIKKKTAYLRTGSKTYPLEIKLNATHLLPTQYKPLSMSHCPCTLCFYSCTTIWSKCLDLIEPDCS